MPGKLSLAISTGLHAGTLFVLLYAPDVSLPSLPKPSPSEYQQAFAGKEDKIVWYKFQQLPKISPQSSPQARQPMRADVISKQAIVSSPKDAPKRTQVVLTPSPEIEMPPLELPNLLAVKLPPKQFTTPPDLVTPEPAKIDTPDAPDAAPNPQLEAIKMPIARLPPKPYVPPQLSPKLPTVPKIDVPTEAEEYVPPATLSTKLPAVHLPLRAFVPPPPRVAPEPRRIADATEVPTVTPNLPNADAPTVKLPPRAFKPPTPAPPKPTPIVEPPAEVTIAIAGLNPATTSVTLPAASSPAQFAVGQTLRSSGATTDGDSKGIVVSDLYADAPKKMDLLAMVTAAPGSKAFVARGEATVPAVTARTTATRVSSAPDHRFNGRDVYMMAIQMSNLTSASGSWLIWYSPRSMDSTALAQLTAPVPYRKVDPKYLPSAVADRVEGKVQLFCVIGRDGKVSSVELVRGADERLNQSAEEALAKWEFYPATRNGQPVDVDVVVEIPFVLAPPPLK
jgi:TonB family protein